MIYTDENMELRGIISDLNQQAIGYVERISALEKDLSDSKHWQSHWKNESSEAKQRISALEKEIEHWQLWYTGQWEIPTLPEDQSDE